MLPNVNGQTVSVAGWPQYGAFNAEETMPTGGTSGEGLTRIKVSFSLDRVSAVYKAISKIQIRSSQLLMIIKS